MPRSRPIRTNFTAGEWSPRLHGRVDLQRYPNAQAELQNFYVLPQGGVTRRPGTRFVERTLNDGEGRLFSFGFSADQAFAAFFGDQHMRLYRDDGVLSVDPVVNAIINGNFASGLTGWANKSTGGASIAGSSGTQQVAAASGTAIGNMTGDAGLASAFDGESEPKPLASSATRDASSATIGKDWGATARTITRFRVVASSNHGFKRNQDPTITLTLQGSNNGFSTLRTLRTVSVADKDGRIVDISSGIDTTSAFFQHRILISGGSASNKLVVSQVEFFERTTAPVGRMALVGVTGGVAIGEQEVIGYTAGTVNVMRFVVGGPVGVEVQVRIGKTSGGTDLASGTFRAGNHTLEFEPTEGGSVFIQFRNANAGTAFVSQVALLGGGAPSREPYELVTPYGVDDVRLLRWLGQRDIVWLPHRSGTQKPLRLVRNGNLSWSLEEVLFNDGPYLDEDPDNTIAIKASAATGDVTLTASADLWQAGHVGASWRIGPIGGVPGHRTWVAEDGDNDIGQKVSLGEFRKFEGNVYRSTTDATKETGNSPPVHEQGIVSDGKVNFEFVNRDGFGWARITEYVSATEVRARVMVELDPSAVEGGLNFVAPGTTVWREGAFSDRRGWPTAVGLYESRLCWAKDRTISMSVTNGYETFTPGDFDDDAITRTLAGERADEILWLVADDVGLIAGTIDGPWLIRSNIQNDPLSSSNVRADPQTTFGSADIQPVKTPWSWMQIGPDRRRLIELRPGVTETSDAGVAGTDVTIVADHILRTGVRELFYARHPHSLVGCVREDGVLVTFTYQRDEEVAGWARQVIGGTAAAVEAACAIPGGEGKRREDEVWLLVRRTVGGVTRRHMEVVQRSIDYDGTSSDGWFPDAALLYEGDPVSTITGLDHLEGETVKIAADGAFHADRAVSGGQVTLDRAAAKAVVGLANAYRLKSLKIAEGGAVGAAVGAKRRATHILIGFVQTLSCRVGFFDQESGEETVAMEFRRAGDLMDVPPPLFTAELQESLPRGWGGDPRIFIRGDDALPLTLTHIVLDDLDTQELR